MRDYFDELADGLRGELRGNEDFTAWFSGEDTDFVRLNHARIRQAGAVRQQALRLQLIDGARHASADVTLSGNAGEDRARLRARLRGLRDVLPQLPDDPHLRLATEVRSSCREPAAGEDGALPPATDMVADLIDAGRAHDLVGILASGPVYRGFANAAGQRNWHGSLSFNVDWSLYLRADKAVKARYAGFRWRPEQLRQTMRRAAAQLDRLALPAKTLPPGRYRAFLTPMAVEEVMGLLGWDAFGARSQRTGRSPLRRLIAGEARLHPQVRLREATAGGIAPNFQSGGFVRPDSVTLIENGEHRASLVSPRSAAEYHLTCNGADADETPQSLDLAAGTLPRAEALARLDAGLYIGNLWYTNYSDRNAARFTGMTRFATFWVEDGELREPVNVLRFDETLYHLLGDGLLGITRERELLLNPWSYDRRSVTSHRLPGLLVDGMRFTL